MAAIDLNGNTDPYQSPDIQQPAPAQAPAQPAGYGDVANYYQKYLGRAAAPDDPNKWLSGAYGYGTDLGTIENAIKGSDEARAYSSRSGGGGGGALNPNDVAGNVNYWMQSNNPQGHQDANYWIQRINETGGLNAGNMGYWQGRFLEAPGTHQEGPTGGGYAAPSYSGTSVFSDPATAQFEKLLNDTISRFNTSAKPPAYQQTIDQLNAYLGKLNGPVYTPEQMQLQQTQAWDPMQAQHDTAVQQLTARMGAQGISPSSGIFMKAMEDLNRQFETAHTQTQANFANQAIWLDRQNQAAAAALAPQISNFEQAQTGWQDQRALQAAQLGQIIPTLAQQRISAAAQQVQPLNPAMLLNSLGSFQNTGAAQGAAYGSQISQLLSMLFGMQQ